MSINSLPNEVMAREVFPYLNPNDAGSLSATSKAFHKLAELIPGRKEGIQVYNKICNFVDSISFCQDEFLMLQGTTKAMQEPEICVRFAKGCGVKRGAKDVFPDPLRGTSHSGGMPTQVKAVARRSDEPSRSGACIVHVRRNVTYGLATGLVVSGTSDASSIFAAKVYKVAKERVKKIEAEHERLTCAVVAGALYAATQIHFG